ncbi:bifunctional 2-polyprenyl-6-hydroxyphenol methylase/3-demethylubiquinol 3-O-methyltransferase UbiG [Aliagarivorans marinus]|uniref:bifunctional 2-polyprenyl-6-hydroxyphenol methylase/3-demethylubiquinol 3-O-methyltransferase UbiG n=1 Tax=Aliagarivorans marinus TaxID=561965 RepID=UPI00047CF75B|nr:bifunctional 2-polyprenyl-6-hydroxyphenol methylase/3-demethylubiquinol 3-O-methyltransferase UbiG [Aliagarivorans marinus]
MDTTEHSSNVDHDEIAHFASLAARWWDENGEFRTLHQINPLRLDYIEAASDGLFGKRVADIGCGGGVLAESMAKRGAKVLGIDMGQEQIEVAKLHALETGTKLEYQQSTAEAIAELHAGEFDVVTCMEMLEHVPDPFSVVAACAKLVKPGGAVFFSTINRNLKAYAMMIVGAENIAKIVPKGTHSYDKFIRPSELLAWCDQQQLNCQDLSGVRYLPVLEQASLSRDVSVNYMTHLSKAEQA